MFQCAMEGEREAEQTKMYKIDYPYVRVGLQLLFNKVCSKMPGLPCRGLAPSIRGCNVKK